MAKAKYNFHGDGTRGKTSRLYRILASMKTRCNNPNFHQYKDYGGRGIKLCDEWKDYQTFKAWALSNGYADNLTIDRINNDGNYEPGNCRWATYKEQTISRRMKYNSTGYPGVKKEPSGRFSSRTVIDGKFKHLGTFDTPQEAHTAYLRAIKMQGD